MVLYIPPKLLVVMDPLSDQLPLLVLGALRFFFTTSG